MKKIILAPDSFKGTMNSIRICDIMEKSVKEHFPEVDVVKIPIADGGEGTLDCFLRAAGGKREKAIVKGPYFEEMECCYGILPDGKTAVVEMATAAGLPLVENRKNPSMTTTFGVGQLIRDAVENGCDKIILGLGGSCTNDGGTGMASALGVRFFNDAGKEFVPTGSTIRNISRIDMSCRLEALKHCSIMAMCDVDNPLFGDNGAAHIYGPQKGADENMIDMLDRNLRYLGDLIMRDLGMDVTGLPGGGAAGGMGAGAVAFIGAALSPGIDIVMDTVEFDTLLEGADYVITGEGKIDAQSLRGKAVVGIGRRAKSKSVPVIALVGDIGDGIEGIYKEGINAVLSINSVAVPFDKARLRCEKDLSYTMDTLMKIIKIK